MKKFLKNKWLFRWIVFISMVCIAGQNLWDHESGLAIMWLYVAAQWMMIYRLQDKEIELLKEMTQLYSEYKNMIHNAIELGRTQAGFAPTKQEQCQHSNVEQGKCMDCQKSIWGK